MNTTKYMKTLVLGILMVLFGVSSTTAWAAQGSWVIHGNMLSTTLTAFVK